VGRSPFGWFLANGKTPSVTLLYEQLLRSVEDLNDARTLLVEIFSVLLTQTRLRNNTDNGGSVISSE